MICTRDLLLIGIGTLGLARAAPTALPSDIPSNQTTCRTILLPIQAAAENSVYPPFPDSTDAGVMGTYLNSFDPSSVPSVPVNGTFNISATYCQPTINYKNRESTIQVLLHGLSLTKEYWNGYNGAAETFPGEYSWVAHAQSQGYSTLAIDNLGNGESDHPDPVAIVQGSLQIAIVQKIIEQLREGSLPCIPKFDKVIFTGHSYGSILGRLLATFYPTAGADAYLLTGAAYNLTGIGSFLANDANAQSASAVRGPAYKDLAPGYQAVDPNSLRGAMYPLDGDFDPKVLQADKAEPHVFPVGEVIGSTPDIPSNFTGPVYIITGRQDAIVCGNGDITTLVPDCGIGAESQPATAQLLFPKASSFGAYIPDRSAHQLNFEYWAAETFGVGHQWLESVGF